MKVDCHAVRASLDHLSCFGDIRVRSGRCRSALPDRDGPNQARRVVGERETWFAGHRLLDQPALLVEHLRAARPTGSMLVAVLVAGSYSSDVSLPVDRVSVRQAPPAGSGMPAPIVVAVSTRYSVPSGRVSIEGCQDRCGLAPDGVCDGAGCRHGAVWLYISRAPGAARIELRDGAVHIGECSPQPICRPLRPERGRRAVRYRSRSPSPPLRDSRTPTRARRRQRLFPLSVGRLRPTRTPRLLGRWPASWPPAQSRGTSRRARCRPAAPRHQAGLPRRAPPRPGSRRSPAGLAGPFGRARPFATGMPPIRPAASVSRPASS